MPIRDDIVSRAEYWADPGEYKPLADELISFFEEAGAEQAPTVSEAEYALKYRGTGVAVGGQVKHWCGVFACYILRQSGVDVRWTLLGGKMKGSQVSYHPGRQGMQPGDVAIIPASNHHFIITDVDYGSNALSSVDGNTMNQKIRTKDKKINHSGSDASTQNIYGYYRVLA